jgi:asparagine synthase (glutamine-hydrolysing)
MYGTYNLKTYQFKCFNESAAINGDVNIRLRGSFFGDKRSDEEILRQIILSQDISQSLRELNGQFAIAIANKKKRSIVIARDQFGVMPLYYTVENNVFIFSTTIGHMLQYKTYGISMNETIIHEYFIYKYIGGRKTFFKDIYELKPGSLLDINQFGEIREVSYYAFAYSDESAGNYSESKELFESEFIGSLKAQTCNNQNVDIGVLSSGGIDSSILVSLSRYIFGEGVKTYYIGYEGYEYNRIEEVNTLSRLYQTKHKSLLITGRQFADNLIETIQINDEPLNHPSTVVRKYLYQNICNEVDVLLSGEGADCFFCGYYIFPIVNYFHVRNPLHHLNSLMARLIIKQILPIWLKGKVTQIKKALSLDPVEYTLFHDILVCNSREGVQSLLNAPLPADFVYHYTSLFEHYSKKSILNNILMLYQTDYIVEALKTITKLGDAYGIQHRHPFINVKLINLFNKFPWKEKLHFFKRKYQIVELGKKYLPKDFFKKPKEGFGVPIQSWFYDKNGLGRFVALLEDRKTRERGIFKTDYLDKLLNKYQTRTLTEDSFECILWPIINFELWNRIFIDNDLTGYA